MVQSKSAIVHLKQLKKGPIDGRLQMLEGLGHGVEHQHVAGLPLAVAAGQLQRVPVDSSVCQDGRVDEPQHRHRHRHIPGRPRLGRLSDAPELAGPDGVHVVGHGVAVPGSLEAAQHPVRPGRAVTVERGDAGGAVEQREGRALAGRRVADLEAAVLMEDDEAVAGSEHVVVVLEGSDRARPPRDRMPLAGAVVQCVDPSLMRVPVPVGEERERGLATVVGEEEFGVGGEPEAPGAADGAAPEEGLHRQTRQDLRDNEILGELGAAAGRFCHGGSRDWISGFWENWIGGRRQGYIEEKKAKEIKDNYFPH